MLGNIKSKLSSCISAKENKIDNGLDIFIFYSYSIFRFWNYVSIIYYFCVTEVIVITRQLACKDHLAAQTRQHRHLSNSYNDIQIDLNDIWNDTLARANWNYGRTLECFLLKHVLRVNNHKQPVAEHRLL